MTGTLDTADHLNSRQFLIAVKKLADTLSYGTDKSPFLGSGIEYAQSRIYQWGDSIRSIDWKLTAKTGKYFVKEYEAPKCLPCYILLDTSASMTITSVRKSKYAVGVHIAGGLAFACLDRVSPVGILGVGGRDFRIEPSLSRGQILQWLHRLRTFRYDESTNLGRNITQLAPTLSSRCLFIVLSDLQDPTALPALKLLAQQHDTIVLQLRDPAEQGIPGAGFLNSGDAETGKTYITRSGRTWLDPDLGKQELKRAGVDHLVIATDRPFAADLRNFLASRGGLGRGKR